MRSIKLHILVIQDIKRLSVQPKSSIFGHEWKSIWLNIFQGAWNISRWRLSINTQQICCSLFQFHNWNGKLFPWILLQDCQWLGDNMIPSWLWCTSWQMQHILYRLSPHIEWWHCKVLHEGYFHIAWIAEGNSLRQRCQVHFQLLEGVVCRFGYKAKLQHCIPSSDWWVDREGESSA